MLRATTTRADSTERRRRYFVDPHVQGALLRQSLYYWLWASATFTLISVVYRVVPAWLSDADQATSRIWDDLGPFMLASAVLLPIVVFSAIRFSNRFAGPMVRIRRTLKQLAQGEAPSHLVLRSDDFWSDIANDINDIACNVRQVSPSTSVTTSIEDEFSEDCARDRGRLGVSEA